MKHRLLSAGILLLLSLTAFAQQRSAATPTQDAAEKKITAVLDEMVRSHQTYLSVPAEDGKALRLLTEAADAKNVVEIGTSTGYSGLWFCLGLRATGGHLTTFEIDHGRAEQARQHFKAAGVENLVTIVEGDAHQQITKLKSPIDVVFIDADKEGYVDYVNNVLPLIRPGGLLLAHNVEMVPDYVKSVTTNPALETIFYREGAGLAITLKKR